MKFRHGITGGQYQATEQIDGTWTIHRVPIFAELPEGARNNEHPIDEKWMRQTVRRHRQLESEDYLPPVHLHHHDEGKPTRRIGFMKNLGVDRMFFDGRDQHVLIVDIVGVSSEDIDGLEDFAAPYRSVEVGRWDKNEIASLALLPDEAPFFKLPMLTISRTGERGAKLQLQEIGARFKAVSASADRNFILFNAMEVTTMKGKNELLAALSEIETRIRGKDARTDERLESARRLIERDHLSEGALLLETTTELFQEEEEEKKDEQLEEETEEKAQEEETEKAGEETEEQLEENSEEQLEEETEESMAENGDSDSNSQILAIVKSIAQAVGIGEIPVPAQPSAPVEQMQQVILPVLKQVSEKLSERNEESKKTKATDSTDALSLLGELRGKVDAMEQRERSREQKSRRGRMVDAAMESLREWNPSTQVRKTMEEMAENASNVKAAQTILDSYVNSFKSTTPKEPPTTLADYERSHESDPEEVLAFSAKGPDALAAARRLKADYDTFARSTNTTLSLKDYLRTNMPSV